MSDWSMYELEDIMWDQFGGGDDHIVPHPGGTTLSNCVHKGDCHKKPWGVSASSVERKAESTTSVLKNALQGKEKTTCHSTLEDGKASMLEKDSWSQVEDPILPAACHSGCINLTTGLSPEDAKITSACFESNNVDSVGNEFCTDDPILGNGGETIGSNLCHFQLGDISAAESELSFFGNGDDQKENSDFLDYGWPDIGNFEDVDRMFRNCDSTFGQGDPGTVDELSWFSTSSHANDRFDDTAKSGFRSSCSEGKSWESASENHETDPKLMLENTQKKQIKSRVQLEGKRKIHSSEYLNGTLHGSGPTHQFSDLKPTSSEPYSSQVLTQQSQLWEPNSFRYLHGYIPYGQQEYGHPSGPSNQFPATPTVSSIESETKKHPLYCKVLGQASNSVPPVEMSANPSSELSSVIPKEKLKMLHDPQKIQTTMSNEHQHGQFMSDATFTDQTPVQKQLHQFQNEVGHDSEVEETGMAFAATEIDSALRENSCMSSVLSNEISLEATSFRQLQDVMEQLDIRTKLCIRDSLYRLARSAEQRHNFWKTNSRSREKRGRSGNPAESSNKHDQSQCLGFVDQETDTNPIDRSIAHLLFYKPSRPSTWPSNDAMSESHVIIHGSTTSEPAMCDQLVYQEDIAGDMDMKLPITK